MLGSILPLLPVTRGVTVQPRIALQLAVVPPPDPAQVQVHGVLLLLPPVTVLAVPVVQRLVGTVVKIPPLSEPQAPLEVRANVTMTLQSPMTGFVW